MRWPSRDSRVANVAAYLVLVAAALLIAGVLSHYASDSPDGLNRVAQDQGFADTEKTRGAPLAGYSAPGVNDERLSGGVAGVAGSLTVLILMAGVALAVRRRDSSPPGGGTPSTNTGPAMSAVARPDRPDRRPDRPDRPDRQDPEVGAVPARSTGPDVTSGVREPERN